MIRSLLRTLPIVALATTLAAVPAAANGSQDNDRADNAQQQRVDDRDEDGDTAHPSGKSRHTEPGNSGTQGKSPSDPDGDSNGGEDKPGGQGGYDEDKDGNNGCGNDNDFEDDNNGNCGGLGKQAENRNDKDDRNVAPSGERTKVEAENNGKRQTETKTDNKTEDENEVENEAENEITEEQLTEIIEIIEELDIDVIIRDLRGHTTIQRFVTVTNTFVLDQATTDTINQLTTILDQLVALFGDQDDAVGTTATDTAVLSGELTAAPDDTDDSAVTAAAAPDDTDAAAAPADDSDTDVTAAAATQDDEVSNSDVLALTGGSITLLAILALLTLGSGSLLVRRNEQH